MRKALLVTSALHAVADGGSMCKLGFGDDEVPLARAVTEGSGTCKAAFADDDALRVGAVVRSLTDIEIGK